MWKASVRDGGKTSRWAWNAEEDIFHFAHSFDFERVSDFMHHINSEFNYRWCLKNLRRNSSYIESPE